MLKLKEEYWKDINKEIEKYFYETYYKELLKIIKKPYYNESVNALIGAIRKGTVHYESGKFTGTFNRTISQELSKFAKYDKRKKAWIGKAPPSVIGESVTANSKAENLNKALKSELDNIEAKLKDNDPGLGFPIEKTFKKIEGEIEKDLQSLAVLPEITPKMEESIIKDYNKNQNLNIKNWEPEQIERLRDMINESSMEGFNRKNLREMIESEYEVSKNKAKFLARQETSLFLTKIRTERFKDAGVTKYKWSTSQDSKVRPADAAEKKSGADHRRLNGKIFTFGDPPIVNIKSGRRAEPGQDYNCLPGNRKISSTVDTNKLFRRFYFGKLSKIIMTDNTILEVTPNHPVLTQRGWIAAHTINNTDYLIKEIDKGSLSIKSDPQYREPSIKEFFSFFKTCGFETFTKTAGNFHGDFIPNQDVNIINIKSELDQSFKSSNIQSFIKFIFTEADKMRVRKSLTITRHSYSGLLRSFGASQSMIGLFGELLLFFKGKLSHSVKVGLTSIAYLDIISNQCFFNGLSLRTIFSMKFKNTRPGTIKFYKFLFRELLFIIRDSVMSDNLKPKAPELQREIIRIDSKLLSNFTKIKSFGVKFVGVKNNFSVDFSGHVYNLQTNSNWFTSEYIIHNCRCVAIPVI